VLLYLRSLAHSDHMQKSKTPPQGIGTGFQMEKYGTFVPQALL
jgi:hypothetical protein